MPPPLIKSENKIVDFYYGRWYIFCWISLDACQNEPIFVLSSKRMTSVGFEPTPTKTTALTLRLRPLGHDVVTWKRHINHHNHVKHIFFCSSQFFLSSSFRVTFYCSSSFLFWRKFTPTNDRVLCTTQDPTNIFSLHPVFHYRFIAIVPSGLFARSVNSWVNGSCFEYVERNWLKRKQLKRNNASWR